MLVASAIALAFGYLISDWLVEREAIENSGAVFSITHLDKRALMADLRNYYVQEALKDGTPVTIRAIRKDDKESILDAFRALDREAVYRRFFSPKKDLMDAELEQVTDVDFRQVVALVATVSQADGEEIVIGDGRYAADKGEKPERAELAFIIAELYRGRGMASLLLRHLARIAQDAGLSAFEADVLAYNEPMLAVLQRSGLPICRRREGDIIHVTLSLRSAEVPELKRRPR